MIEFEISTSKKQIDFDITQGIPKYVPANFQSKTVVPTTEQQIIRADFGYDGLEQVTVEPIKVLDKTITQNGAYSANEENIDGYSSVFVNVQPTLQEKSITITENGTTEVVADSGYDGLAKVSVEANVQDNSLLNVIKGMNSYKTTNYPFELTDDMLDENSTQIYQYKYSYNYNITKVEILSNITTIGKYAFSDCENIVSVDIPNVKTVDEYAFNTNSKLINFNAPNLVTINGNAFQYCTSLETIDLPNLTTINSYRAFERCSKLVNINLPKLTSLGMDTFDYCRSLKTIYLPKVVGTIGYIFQNCTSLETVNIPNVDTVGQSTFNNCTALKVIDFRERTTMSVPTLSYTTAFRNVPTTCKFIIPDELYDSWIASTNWVSLYNNGYQFVKASEYTEA